MSEHTGYPQIALDRLERQQRDAKRTEVCLQRRQREQAKRQRLQAELDAMKPKTAALKKYSDEYAGLARGAKNGVHMGGGRLSIVGY